MGQSSAMETNLPLPKQFGTELLVIRKGDGVWLEDSAGKRYLDFSGGIAVNALGYNREDIARVVYEQMKRLPHISNVFANEPALTFGRTVVASGNFGAVHFGNSGTEANEAALKYARLYAYRTKGKGHEKLLCFANAFHGRTMGALSVTPNPQYQDPFAPLIPKVSVAPFNDVAALEKTLDGSFAGVIVEVVQGEGGLALMTKEFAAVLNRLCRKHDVILIADEVQTGLGRTGTLYASTGVGLEPDIITLAKPLAGGLPLSATLIPSRINDILHPGDHGTTFGGGPVTTAVAAKVWEIISNPAFLKEVRRRGGILGKALQGLKDSSPRVGELRGLGMLQGFEYIPADGGPDLPGLLAALREKGLLALRSGSNVLRIAPPLVIEEKEILHGIDIIREVLK
jgi:acetylornithine/N-succinyldiaminopimelate aminotransferase